MIGDSWENWAHGIGFMGEVNYVSKIWLVSIKRLDYPHYMIATCVYAYMDIPHTGSRWRPIVPPDKFQPHKIYPNQRLVSVLLEDNPHPMFYIELMPQRQTSQASRQIIFEWRLPSPYLTSPAWLLFMNLNIEGMASKHKGSYGAFEIQCKVCKFKNKVYPPNRYKPSSIPCPDEGYPSDFTCLGCNQKNSIYWCLD